MTELVTGLLVGLVLLNGLMYVAQPHMIFYPLDALDATPSDWGLEYRDVALRTDDGVELHGWYIPREGARQVLLFLHGNAGNVSHRRESIDIFHRLGLDVFIIDYRGYGRSRGRPDEPGLYRDAEAAWRYLTDERGFDPADIVIFGRSLGGAVAAQLASGVRPGGVILESSFSSAREFARAQFPVLSRLILLRYDFAAAAAMRRVQAPVLVLHSRDDEIVPFELGRKLYTAANEPKRFVELRGGHNTGFLTSQPDYEVALEDFLTTITKGTP